MLIAGSVLGQVNLERLRSLPLNSDLDSIILAEIYDSLSVEYSPEDNMHIDEGYIVAPIDSSFKVYIFEGEGCGAYCNPFWEIFWSWENEKENHLEIDEAEGVNENIDSILRLSENQYLLFGHSHGRARGIEGVGCKTVSLVQMGDDPNIIWHFDVCTSNLASEDQWICEMVYDAKSKAINYRYQWYEEQQEYRSYLLEGQWEYNGTTFIQTQHVKTYND